MPRDPNRELRKRRRLEILKEVAVGGRKREWFEGKVPSTDERTEQATNDLVRMGFIEGLEGYPCGEKHPYRLTERGRAFLDGVVARIGESGPGDVIIIDWKRADEIEFQLLNDE